MRKWVTLIIFLFIASRAYILANPPWAADTPTKKGFGYSDVQQDYERYANMWYYGLTPYLKHFFEYPPATIPFILFPLQADLGGLGYYYLNYRTQIAVLESLFFVLFLAYVVRKKIEPAVFMPILLLYIGLGTIAKDYWFDGIDLLFIMTFTTGLILRDLVNHDFLKRYLFWLGFWFSVGVKLMTAPLLIPFVFLYRKNWLIEIKACFFGFLSIWGIPLLLYRSSLSVMLVFHAQRPLKHGSLGVTVIKTINDFTHTEELSKIAPHFPWVGPWSSATERIVTIAFPFFMSLVLVWLTWIGWKWIERTHSVANKSLTITLVATLVYFMTLFLTGKIFSSPFHIWYVPLITAYSLTTKRVPGWLWVLALWMILLDTTQLIKAPVEPILGPFNWDRVRDWSRFVPMGIILFWGMRELGRFTAKPVVAKP